MVQTNVGPVQAMWMLLSSLLMFSNFYRLDLEHLHHAVERHALEKPFEALQALQPKILTRHSPTVSCFLALHIEKVS